MTTTLTPPAVTPAPATPARRAERVALGVLLAGTAVLHLWDLGANGWANSYYAAAVQAMSRDWTAFLFGSLDTGNVITVDKPPAALWAMALSARIFGFSAWSMLVPQALMGVAAVGLLHAAVRRVSGPVAGLVAGAAFALTPVAVLMFRFNNPDALLVLLMVAAAYAVVRAIERAGTRWLVLAGLLIGFAFLAKMAQGFVVLPALALAYLVAAPTGSWRRVRQLLAAAVAVVVGAGWWVALVELWPAGGRPYIGGSETDSALELALGYNGLGRLFGQGGGGPAGPGGGGAGGGGGLGGGAGPTRMFSDSVGGQVSWLLPAALALLLAGLWLTRRAPRTDAVRASLLLWGGWTVVTALVFSLMEGIFHEYYTVALAPGIAALVGVGGRELWRYRTSWAGRITLAVVTAGSAGWAWVLLGRTPEFLPWLRWLVVGVAAVAVSAVLLGGSLRRAAAAVLAAVVVSGLLGPAAYAAQTATTPQTGSIVLAGPEVAGGGFGGAFPGGGPAGARPGAAAGGTPGGGLPGDGAEGGAGPGGATPGGTAPGDPATGWGPWGSGAGRDGGSRTGGPGSAGEADPELVALLRKAGTAWSAATVGAQGAAALQLTGDAPVIAIGGFSGGDPAPTLAQFQAYVAAGEVRYFVAPDQGGPAGDGPGAEITNWVASTLTATTVGGRTVYDLAAPLGRTS
ncbi:glycosyltransferase family 39 protein [Pseudonocardia sp.]|uniref:ArnT family glycosyltransferase n=1 Tax=Pseudonocardia sp. TaxID=60912 RepID=UPI0026371623|nr:glycosyltransferase family 39 protein [Pseudonocardia sp.]